MSAGLVKAVRKPVIPDQVATALDDLTVEVVEGEPRASALQLAELLGFKKPIDIKGLLERNREELEVLGRIYDVRTVRMSSMPHGGTKEIVFDVPWLNRTQCLIVAMKVETPTAVEARAKIAKSFEREQDRAAAVANGATLPANDQGRILEAILDNSKQVTALATRVCDLVDKLATTLVPRSPRPRAPRKATAPAHAPASASPGTQLALASLSPAFDLEKSAAAKGEWLTITELAMKARLPGGDLLGRSKSLVTLWLQGVGFWHATPVSRNVTLGQVSGGNATVKNHWVYDPSILDEAEDLREATKAVQAALANDERDPYKAARALLKGAA